MKRNKWQLSQLDLIILTGHLSKHPWKADILSAIKDIV
jgi:hypothetical protein